MVLTALCYAPLINEDILTKRTFPELLSWNKIMGTRRRKK